MPGDGDDTLYEDDEAAVTGALDFQENALVAFHRAGGHADAGALGQVQLFRLEVEKSLVIICGGGNEGAHLGIRYHYLFPGPLVHHILEIWNPHAFLQLPHPGRSNKDENQVVDCRNQDFPAFVPGVCAMFFRNVVFNAQIVQDSLGCQLATVGHAHCKPYFILFRHPDTVIRIPNTLGLEIQYKILKIN